MKKIFILLFIIFFYSCTNVSESKNPIVEKKQQSQLVLLFVDLTPSVDNQSIGQVASKAFNLFLSFPPGSKVFAYSIEDNVHNSPLFVGDIPAISYPVNNDTEFEDQKLAYKIDQKKLNEKNSKQHMDVANSIKQKILDKYSYNTNNLIKNSSCIINTLETAYDFLKDKCGGEYTARLIYLSDMIEQCESSSTGPIDILHSNKIDDIVKQIGKNYKPAFNLRNLIGDNVSIIITTKIVDDKMRQKQKKVWNKVFSMIGYGENRAQDFFIYDDGQ